MKRLALLLLALPLAASAQPRGRTDGPEGSEYGTGGYSRSSEGHFSLEANWGASLIDDQYTRDFDGAPLFVGLTASYWGDDWYQMDLSGAYLFNDGRFNLLAGPRFRTTGYPVSFHLGLKAGAIFIPDTTVRFGLSPQVGADVLFANDHVLAGLAYAVDVPVGGGGVANRIFMNVGYRF